MTALKIKNELLRIIINTDDVEVLSQITNYAHSIQNDDGFKLTEEQLKQIEQSEEDIREGRVYTNEEAKKKIKAFMQKKIQEAK